MKWHDYYKKSALEGLRFNLIDLVISIFQHHSGERGAGKRETLLAPILQHQTSTEDVENPSTQLVQVQLR